MHQDLSLTDYQDCFARLKHKIQTAQLKTAWAVNRELILLYWEVGREILLRQQEQGWGTKVIERLSQDLKREFPALKGFSPRNLKYMRAFAEAWPEVAMVHQLGAQIPWKHNCTILDKLKTPEQRVWYLQKTLTHGWSRAVLTHHIETDLYGRQGQALTNFEAALPDAQSDLAQQMLKSSYDLQFLGLKESAKERELEQALITHMRDFLLELGVGFAFLGNQFRLEVEGNEFFIDLLFYHVKLRCYVVLELKTTEFRPEYAGQINFYVNAVDDLLRHPDDQPTLGLILCRSHQAAVVQYTLKGISSPLGVSTYSLLPKTLRDNLPSAEQLQQELEQAAGHLEQNLQHTLTDEAVVSTEADL